MISRIKTFLGLIPHLRNRLVVSVRNWLGGKHHYPTEPAHTYTAATEAKLKTLALELEEDSAVQDSRWSSGLSKEKKATLISSAISNAIEFDDSRCICGAVSELEHKGWTPLRNKALSGADIASIHDYLADKPVYPSHVAHWSANPPMSREQAEKAGGPYGSYDIETILQAPGIARLVADGEVISTVAKYFGCIPTICSINLFWSFYRGDRRDGVTQQFHRDVDDVRSSNFFCLLSDTAEQDGAYLHIEQTHTINALKSIFDHSKNNSLLASNNPLGRPLEPDDFFKLPFSFPHGHGYDDLYHHFFSPQIKRFYGVPGLPMLTDGHGLHKGTPPSRPNGKRLLFWTTYTLTNNAIQSAANNQSSWLNVNLPPWRRVEYKHLRSAFESNEMTQYVLRNIVRF